MLLPASDQRGSSLYFTPRFLLLLLLPQINSIFFLFPKDLVETILIMIATLVKPFTVCVRHCSNINTLHVLLCIISTTLGNRKHYYLCFTLSKLSV